MSPRRVQSRVADAMTSGEFITKWRASQLKESAASQEHFIDLCRLLGDTRPLGGWVQRDRGEHPLGRIRRPRREARTDRQHDQGLGERFDAHPAEIRRFLNGRPNPERTVELGAAWYNAGIPTCRISFAARVSEVQ